MASEEGERGRIPNKGTALLAYRLQRQRRYGRFLDLEYEIGTRAATFLSNEDDGWGPWTNTVGMFDVDVEAIKVMRDWGRSPHLRLDPFDDLERRKAKAPTTAPTVNPARPESWKQKRIYRDGRSNRSL